MVARSSTNRFAEQRSTLERSAVFSFKLKISNPERVDMRFREFDDIVFDLRLTELMTESQPTLARIQSHFTEIDDADRRRSPCWHDDDMLRILFPHRHHRADF